MQDVGSSWRQKFRYQQLGRNEEEIKMRNFPHELDMRRRRLNVPSFYFVSFALLGILAALTEGIRDLRASEASTGGTFKTLKIGGGGWVSGIDIECDSICAKGTGTSTKVIRTDTYGAYYYNPNSRDCNGTDRSGCWQQLVLASNMPFPTVGESSAIYEIRIAPSNTQIFYMYSNNGYIYKNHRSGNHLEPHQAFRK